MSKKESKFVSAMLHADLQEVPKKKKCNICKELLDITKFHDSPRNKDGHANACRTCASKKAYERTKKQREIKKFYDQFMPI